MLWHWDGRRHNVWGGLSPKQLPSPKCLGAEVENPGMGPDEMLMAASGHAGWVAMGVGWPWEWKWRGKVSGPENTSHPWDPSLPAGCHRGAGSRGAHSWDEMTSCWGGHQGTVGRGRGSQEGRAPRGAEPRSHRTHKTCFPHGCPIVLGGGVRHTHACRFEHFDIQSCHPHSRPVSRGETPVSPFTMSHTAGGRPGGHRTKPLGSVPGRP